MWRLPWVLIAAVTFLLTACTPNKVRYADDQLVLQLQELVPPVHLRNHTADFTPPFTLWGGGRVVFLAQDRSLREAHLTATQVQDLVNRAARLQELRDS